MCDDEPRFHPDHIADNLDIPDDAGPHATARIIEDHDEYHAMKRKLEAARAMLSRSISEGADREWPRTVEAFMNQP